MVMEIFPGASLGAELKLCRQLPQLVRTHKSSLPAARSGAVTCRGSGVWSGPKDPYESKLQAGVDVGNHEERLSLVLPRATSPTPQCRDKTVGDDRAMSSFSVQGRLAARLAQQAQWRIAANRPQNLPAARATCQHRAISREAPATKRLFSSRSPRPSQTVDPQSSQPDPPPPRRRRAWVSTSIFLLVGLATGTFVRAVISPPPPLLPGTDVDASLTRDVRRAAAELPVVKRLLSDPEWSSFHHDAYEGVPPEARAQRITTGPLSGARGVGAYQHIFHNSATGEVVSVVWLGPGTIGWPGVTHGGLIATLLDEHSARAALKDLAAGGGGGLLTANLNIAYKRPTLASNFYVLRARAVPEEGLAPEERGKRGRKVWVDATIETADGQTCVECRSLFVSPKSVSLRRVPENF